MGKGFRKADMLLIAAAVIMAVGYYGTLLEGIRVKDSWYDEKLRASQLMHKAMNSIREEKVRRGILTGSEDDINNTGIIGTEWSPITTTLGSLEAKRTSSNPEFAAVLVDMLKETGLRKGDYVAVNLSGSFPALNIAVVSAIEVMGLDKAVISSAGASAWGANNPEFTYIDMEQFLYEKGVSKFRSEAVSLGGIDDIGKEMEEDTVNTLLERFKNQNRRLIYQPDLELNIKERLDIYEEKGKPIKCFINVGGNLLSSGGSEDFTKLHTGIIKSSEFLGSKGKRGLIQIFLDRGIPVINLLNIKGLAVEYDIPIDPYPLPAIGEGNIYYEYRYSYILAAVCAGLAILMLAAYRLRVRR